VKGAAADSNPTSVRVASCLESGRLHTSIVEVGRDGARAWLDA